MMKRAKDLTYMDKLITEAGIAEVHTVDTDMDAGTVLVGVVNTLPLIFGAEERVETLD
jgi:hypothetical protein